jgi:hypothetical protein
VGDEARESVNGRHVRYATPGVFASSVRKRLKNKEIAKPSDPYVRKRIERKELGDFLAGRTGGRMPKGLPEASC